ncbi:g-type lectin s-receptor-like serine/threonine-protein kinase [Fagus crenata]
MRISKAFSVCLGIFSCFFVYLSHAVDTLRPGENLYDTETLVSASGVFELGFFGSIESSNEYLGIVWVANRDTPLMDSPVVLSIRYDGNLVISGRGPIPRIVNYGQLATSNDTSAKILDSGNLILMEGAKIIWQSFQYPTDTFLPGMKLGWFDVDTDHVEKSFLVSWLSLSVPGSGSFALGLDSDTRTSFNVWRRDGAYQQIGFWDGHTFRFFFQNSSDSHSFSFFSNSKEIYLTFNNNEGNYFSWFVLASNGEINEFKMEGQDISVVNHSLCDDTLVHNSTGCLVTMPSKCRDGGDFSEIRGLMPNSMVVNWTVHIGPIDCELMCSSNCSCTAYASLRDDETGCEFYYGDKSDLLTMIERGNNTVYVRGDALQSGMMKYLPWSNEKEEEKELKLEIKEEEEEEEEEDEEEEEEGEEGEEEYEYDPEDFVFESDEDLYIDEAFALQYRNNRNNSGYKEMPEVEYEYGVEYDDDKEEFKEDDIDFQYLR